MLSASTPHINTPPPPRTHTHTRRHTHFPTVASIYLLMIPLICESFSTCCCRSRLSLSSRRFWYCRRILLVCCSCMRSLLSYSSSFLWDIRRRSFRALISSSYSRTWGEGMSDTNHRQACVHIRSSWKMSVFISSSRLCRRASATVSPNVHMITRRVLLLSNGACCVVQNVSQHFFHRFLLEVTPTLSMRDSSMLLEYSFSLNSSRSIRELSMSAERWGMLETQATVRSLTGVGGFNVDGDWEPWGEKRNSKWSMSRCDFLQAFT